MSDCPTIDVHLANTTRDYSAEKERLTALLRSQDPSIAVEFFDSDEGVPELLVVRSSQRPRRRAMRMAISPARLTELEAWATAAEAMDRLHVEKLQRKVAYEKRQVLRSALQAPIPRLNGLTIDVIDELVTDDRAMHPSELAQWLALQRHVAASLLELSAADAHVATPYHFALPDLLRLIGLRLSVRGYQESVTIE